MHRRYVIDRFETTAANWGAMELDLAGIVSFLALVDERHFGRAASKMNMTSSALTKRIQRLERHWVSCWLTALRPGTEV
jgi:hypothetical protein